MKNENVGAQLVYYNRMHYLHTQPFSMYTNILYALYVYKYANKVYVHAGVLVLTIFLTIFLITVYQTVLC